MRAFIVLLFGLAAHGQKSPPFEREYQYHLNELAVPRAASDEPFIGKFSPRKALDYLEKGALVWVRQAGCVSCHTAGTYMLVRPQLARFGPPSAEVRDFFVRQLDFFDTKPPEWFKAANPQQVIYTAAGLAEYDARVGGKLSEPTARAIEKMLSVQLASGTWEHDNCWPPLESSGFHAATIAARAIAVAPGWLERQHTDGIRQAVERLTRYLRGNNSQNDYDRVSLLWTAAQMPDLIDKHRRGELVEMVRGRQNKDGGWSLRTFAKPEEWGRGNRVDRLRAEPEFTAPASDGHMTGLALLALLDNGVSPKDATVRRGIRWLRANQRESGRWWTRSLNTDKWNYITYSGSAYALLALEKGR